MSELNTIVYNLQNRIHTAANEAEVRDRFCNELRPHYNLEFRYERGRSDARLNNVIFEFKDKGLFRGSIESAKFKEAYQQLTDLYIPRHSEEEGKPKHEYIGVAIDGLHYAFVFYEKNGLHRHTALSPVDQEGLYPLIATVKSDKRRAFSVENILEDFGSGSLLSQSMLIELYKHLNQCLENPSKNKTKMLFEEWQKLFAQATSLGFISRARLDGYLSRSGFSQPYNYTRFLFVLHTYNALLLKLIAAEVVTTIRYSRYSGFASQVSAQSLSSMQKMIIERIEHATVFTDNNIRNFIEGTFFSWYIEDAPITLLTEIRRMLAQLGLYIFPTTREERIRDVVKLVYENLVPDALRKNIGEFYTPDWLVNFTLDETGYKGEDILCKRLLDPCCGSGNFLIHSIARIKSEASKCNLSNDQVLAHILNNVVGFDLNPLAVLSARLNYLLSVLDILTPIDEIEIPVYMADAVYAPVREDVAEVPVRTYQIGTMMQSIDIELPEELVQTKQLFGKMLSAVESNVEFDEESDFFVEEMRRDEVLEKALDTNPEWTPYLTKMYERIREMERQKWDRIWCRVIRNYFASITIGKVDFIVGNPPWVRWSDLPEDYRQRIKPTCEQYDIFSKTPFFGGNELDISGMIAYTVTDRWLDVGGVLGFVITQIHFQAPSSEGFRSFALPDNTPLKVLQVHDLSKAKPFPKLSNKTAVFSWRVGEKTQYPVEYFDWERQAGQSIPESATLEEALNLLKSTKLEAVAIPPDQRWSILKSGSTNLMQRLSGGTEYWVGRKGVTADLNGAYFVKLLGKGRHKDTVRIQTNPAGSRKFVPLFEHDIEKELVYPLLKGARQISAFKYEPIDLVAIIPNQVITSIPSTLEFRRKYPYAYRYFQRLNKELNRNGIPLLEGRSTWRTRMKATDAPFYAIYNVGDYTFKEFKIVWAEMSKSIKAAVVTKQELPFGLGEKVIVPDHKVYFSATDNEDEAYYLCGMLNSEIIRTFVDSFTVKLQVGTLFKHLYLPPYDAENRLHKDVVEIAQQAQAQLYSSDLQNRLDDAAQRIVYKISVAK